MRSLQTNPTNDRPERVSGDWSIRDRKHAAECPQELTPLPRPEFPRCRFLISRLITLTLLLLLSCGPHPLAVARVWEDTNCNGEPDSEEKALSGICVWYSSSATHTPDSEYCRYPTNQTESDGHWSRALFDRHSCSGLYMGIQIPDGFQPTTDTLTEGCTGAFGLAPESTCPKRTVRTPADLIAEREQQLAKREQKRQTWVTVCGLGLGAFGGAVLLGIFLHNYLYRKAHRPNSSQ
jgi:hypothetical protein